MKAIPAALVLLGLALLAPVVSAEETLEEMRTRLNTLPDTWKDFAPGSWVELRHMPLSGTSEEPTEVRQTLVTKDAKSVTLDFQMVTRTVDAAGKESIVLSKPQTVVQPLPVEGPGWANLKELRREDLEIGDRKYPCRVVEATYITKPADQATGQAEVRAKTTLWVCAEVKEMNGILKTKGGMPVGPLFYDLRVKELGRKVKLGEHTVTCYSYDYVSLPQPGMPSVSGEVTMSPEVPNSIVAGMFGVEDVPRGQKAPQKPTMKMKYEAIDLFIVKPK